MLNCVLALIDQRLVTAAHDCSKGGLVIALAKMCMNGNLGAQIDITPMESEKLRTDALLFSESHSRFILSLKKDQLNAVKNLAQKYSVPFYPLGKVTKDPTFNLAYSTGKIKCELNKMKRIWLETIPKMMKG